MALVGAGGFGGAGGLGGAGGPAQHRQRQLPRCRPITGDARADDRRLLAYRLGDGSRPALIGATARHVLTGARRSQAEPAFLVASELWLCPDPPLPLDVDGEISGQTPVRITLAANALRVMVDPGFPDT